MRWKHKILKLDSFIAPWMNAEKFIWKVKWWFRLLIPRCFLIYIHHFHWAEELKRFKMHWIPSSASPFLTLKETFLNYSLWSFLILKFPHPIYTNTGKNFLSVKINLSHKISNAMCNRATDAEGRDKILKRALSHDFNLML